MLPVLMLTILACMQVCLLFFARSIALAAAQEGVRAARADTASRTAGAAIAQRYAEATANGLLSSIRAHTSGDEMTIRITVQGESLSLVPFLPSISITEEAAGAVERFTTPRRGHMTLKQAVPVRSASRGSATVEAMVLIPAVMLVLLLGLATGRVIVATFAVEAAARDAARQASIARTSTEAAAHARTSATNSLRGQGVKCSSIGISVDTSGFGRPVGSPATVSATVSCIIPLADVAFPGLPGSTVRKATFTSPLDPYRGRTLGLMNLDQRRRYE